MSRCAVGISQSVALPPGHSSTRVCTASELKDNSAFSQIPLSLFSVISGDYVLLTNTFSEQSPDLRLSLTISTTLQCTQAQTGRGFKGQRKRGYQQFRNLLEWCSGFLISPFFLISGVYINLSCGVHPTLCISFSSISRCSLLYPVQLISFVFSWSLVFM